MPLRKPHTHRVQVPFITFLGKSCCFCSLLSSRLHSRTHCAQTSRAQFCLRLSPRLCGLGVRTELIKYYRLPPSRAFFPSLPAAHEHVSKEGGKARQRRRANRNLWGEEKKINDVGRNCCGSDCDGGGILASPSPPPPVFPAIAPLFASACFSASAGIVAEAEGEGERNRGFPLDGERLSR